MRTGEILIARLAKETSLVRYLSHTKSRVTIALNRNKQARIPHNRVLLNTELVSTGDQDFERLRGRGLLYPGPKLHFLAVPPPQLHSTARLPR